MREEKIRGGGGVGGKQDDDEGSGQFVSFVPLPTQAEIESAILAKRKAELLQVRQLAAPFQPQLLFCFSVCFCSALPLALLVDSQRYASKELLESQAITAAVAGSSKRGRD